MLQLHGTIKPLNDQTSEIDQCLRYGDFPLPNTDYQFATVTNWFPPLKTAREQVQEEILNKVLQAINKDDIKKAKELLELAKKLKEL